MARRGRAHIGFGLATDEGRSRDLGKLVSGLAAAFAAVLLSCAGTRADDGLSTPDFAARWGAWGEIGGTYGTGQSSYGEIAVFAPLWQSPDSLFFADIHGKYFETDLIEGNFALGGRHMLPSGWNVGAWGALDVRKTANDNYFGQVSGGLEALSERFDARLNGYLPFTGLQGVDGAGEVILDGNNIFMVGGGEVALYGVDGEVGGRLPLGEGNAATLGVYGGGFWFDSPHVPQAITGGKARVELAFNDAVGAGSQVSAHYAFTHDNVRGDRHLVGARLRIPLGATPVASTVPAQWRRMADRIERDVDIVIGPSGKEAVDDTLTEVRFDQVAYVPDAGSVTTTSTNAGDNTLILANGTVSGPQQLQGNQTLQGGGSTIAVRGRTSGTVADFTAPGAVPMLNNPGDAVNLTLLGDNIHVAGLNIQGAGQESELINNSGIRGVGVSNIVIDQTSIVEAGELGISFGSSNNVLISRTTVARFGSAGIVVGSSSSDFTITDTLVTDGRFGIVVATNMANVTVANTVITDIQSSGFFFFDNAELTVTGVTMANVGVGFNFLVDGNNTKVTISGTTITDGLAGINIGGGANNTVVLTDSTITDMSGDGINIGGGNNTVTIAGTTIANVGGNGIFVHESSVGTTIAFDNSAFAGTFGANGFLIENETTLSGVGNTAAGATFSGQFCSAPSQTNGSFIAFVDDGDGDPGTCPP